jgi:transposase-like protein
MTQKIQEFTCPGCDFVFEDLVENGIDEIQCPRCAADHGIICMAKRTKVCIPKHAKNSSWKASP